MSICEFSHLISDLLNCAGFPAHVKLNRQLMLEPLAVCQCLL